MSQTVYAYRDTSLNTVMVEESYLNFTGTWASTGTYVADTRDVANYGASRFIAVRDSINVVPTAAVRRGQTAKWSDLVVIRPGAGTNDTTYELALLALGVANSALGVANGAFIIAVAGTNLADEAMQMAINGTNAAALADAHAAAAAALAYTALQTAWAGTSSYSEQSPWAGTMFVDLQGATYQRIPINGDTLIEVVNPSVVKGVTAILVSGTVADCPIRFTDGIIWFGQAEPDVLTGGQRMLVNFTSFGTITAEVHAAYAVQA